MQHRSASYQNYVFSFERINVILGANGSGKSKLLTEIKDSASSLTGGAKAVYIEGGRTIKIKDVLKLDRSNFEQFDQLDSAISHYFNKRATSLADRVFDALVVLDKRDAQMKSCHSDAVDRWIKEGRNGDCPQRSQPPLEHLFEMFSEIFPQITLTYDSSSRRLSAKKNGQTYGPSKLSDGEKQVFSILADLIELDATHRLIVADEPELNLHPELAERLWTLIENEFPDKTFIYATHSISFALRTNVNRVWVLSANAESITDFSGLESLPRVETTAFLGGLPGILSANDVLVTEGHEKSFDAIFFRWLLDDKSIEIYPGGSCHDVAAIVTRTGLWDKISTKVQLRGVVDADFRDDSLLSSLKAQRVHVLDLHEAEAYLCLPQVICAIAERIGSQAKHLSTEEVVNKVMSSLQEQRLIIATKRLFQIAKISLAVSLEKRLFTEATDQSRILEDIKTAAKTEVKKAEEQLAPLAIEAMFNAELAAIDQALSAQDVVKALRFLPAKELLRQLAPRAGCKNGADLMRALSRNFRPSDFQYTSELANALSNSAL